MRLLPLLFLLAYAVLLVRTAWMCDDAFITLRTVDNFVQGYGLVWNVGERVQAYTHPLWMFLLSAFYAFTREPYFTTLAISMTLSLATVALLL
jgi:arabinofuranosyltransferase